MNAPQMEYYIKNSPLVRVKEDEYAGVPVLVVKYKNKVFYDNLWTDELLSLRGVVLDLNYRIISNPFIKVFNYTENNARISLSNRVLAVEKINGFMAAVTYYNGKMLVSTTGTVSSEYADMARRYIEPRDAYFRNAFAEIAGNCENPNITMIFEVCAKEDPHIIVENEGIYLLGVRENRWDAPNNLLSQKQLDTLADQLIVMRPHWRTYQEFSELLDILKTCKHEGYMVYDIGENQPIHYMKNAEPVYNTIKLKSPLYLTVKFLGRISEKKFNLMIAGPETFKKNIDEEFYKIVDYIVSIKDTYMNKTAQERVDLVREYFLGELNNESKN